MTSNEGILFFRKTLTEHPLIRSLLTVKDEKKWEIKMGTQSFLEEILHSKFNLLNILIYAGVGNRLQDNPALHRLGKLEYFLRIFPELKSDSSFKDKIKNLEGLNFLAALIELSLADFFHKMGYSIEFEKSFIKIETGNKKDVDVTVTDKEGNSMHFDVYMPAKEAEIDGFFGPNEDDNHFDYKVSKKLTDKFGTEGITGLNGKTF